MSPPPFPGRTGRYTLKEKFKEYERNVTPEERLLEALGKYGEQAREVQLALHHNGPTHSTEDEAPPGTDTVRLRGPRYQSGGGGGGQLRRAHGHRGSEGKNLNLNRQSLPPLSRLKFQSEPIPEETRKPKRKSLTLMEEAWGWLESLGRGSRQQSSPRDRTRVGKEDHKGAITTTITSEHRANRLSQSLSDQPTQVAALPTLPPGRNRRDKGQAIEVPRVIGCLGSFARDDDQEDGDEKKMRADIKVQRNKRKDSLQQQQHANLPFLRVEDLHVRASREVEEQKEELRALILHQQSSRVDLQSRINTSDDEICTLMDQQSKRQTNQEKTQTQTPAHIYTLEEAEEAEQLAFWENELRDEEGFERDLQQQFLELKEKAGECKASLQEYQRRLEELDLSSSLATLFPKRDPRDTGKEAETERQTAKARLETPSTGGMAPHTATRPSVQKRELFENAGARQSRMGSLNKTPSIGAAHSITRTPAQNRELFESLGARQSGASTSGRQRGGAASAKLPRMFVAPVQSSSAVAEGDARMSDRRQLREWWARWSAGQAASRSEEGSKSQAVHRSEITIHLRGTRV